MPTVYNAANIQAWSTEALSLNSQKQHHQAIITENNQALIPLQSQLQLLQTQISTVQGQVTSYEIRNAQDNAFHWQQSHHHGHHHGHHHHHHSPGILHTAVDIFSAFELGRLRNQLSDLQADARRIEARMRPHLQLIENSSRIIQQTDSRLSWLNYHSNNGAIFLNTLSANPNELVNQLKRKITAAFQDYDDKHPQGLSPQVRICLFNLKERLAYLTLTPEQATINALQRNYLHLGALLQEMHNQVATEGLNQEFIQVLNSLLEETHLGADLPDALQTQQSKAEHYNYLQQQNPALFTVSPERLLVLEQERYHYEFSHLQERIAPSNALQNKINAALKVLNEELSAKKVKNEVIDYHFYNRVLADLAKISANPHDSKAIQHLGRLANVAVGTPSLGKKIAGVLLEILGIALIAASVTCLIATFGGSSFASSFGAALGLSLLQSQITLGISASLTALGGGALSFWGGIKFKEGQRQGLSKELENVHEEAMHPSFS
ncbi:hypothetical protein [Legionella sp. km772]|uniref:hypothetical protein n=1 Tax=Legionella sp. km772 TaxID=2498111 RepID=UPI000F8E5C19|nr:hypothetical protein [Legionella sp. km772]